MATVATKPESSTMTQEVRNMIALRHSAEQRGHFEVLGRLLSLRTDHGTIQFPAKNGEWSGPDVAAAMMPIPGREYPSRGENLVQGEFADWNTLCVLGAWSGLPSLLRSATRLIDCPGTDCIRRTGRIDPKCQPCKGVGKFTVSIPCPKCTHVCDQCDGLGTKQCEGFQCGGRGWTPGVWLPCPGAGCVAETGGFEKGFIKEGCLVCRGSGQVPDQVQCKMCLGTKIMSCARCKGTGEFSTGKINGTIDWTAKQCPACEGLAVRSERVRQDVNIFTNATLRIPRTKTASAKGFLVLGPIRQFVLQDVRSLLARTFDVTPDSAGDLLVLLVPRSARQKPQKAYLVGGVVREREGDKRVSA